MPPFLKVIAARILTSLLVLLGVSVLIFAIARVIPGDPARIALGGDATPEAVSALRLEMRLDDPLLVQYGDFLGRLMQGDLGVSLYTGRPVATDIAMLLPATLELVFVSATLMVLIGLPLGLLAARFRNSWCDHAIRVMTLLTVSAPAFVWAVSLMMVFAYFAPIFPISGRLSDGYAIQDVTGFLLIDTLIAGNIQAFGDAAWHIVLPALALAMSGIGQTARLTRSNMVETYHKPFIEMATAYGFPEGRIARRYAFRPSLIPSLTVIGMDIAAKLGNAFLVEAVFVWPGLSRYGVAVILRKDLNAIVGTVLIISAMFLIMNIIVDLLVTLINPLMRYSQRAT